ncbi:DNA-binding transcriptional regulator, LysR family [Sphingobium faniae]|nr:DNA-binding transcriptional regulator, LysR family [Sphingobium faniae]
MMERYLLRYFLAVVDQGSFSRAAAHCNVSQPSLSVGIAKLEKALGAQLFFRSNQRMQLTHAGTRLLGYARRIEAEFNSAQRAIAEEMGEQQLNCRLGVLHSVPGAIIAAAVADLSDAERSSIEILYGSERDLVGKLDRGRIDVALSLTDRGGGRFLEQPLVKEGYAIAMPSSHPLAARAEIGAEEIASETMIVRRHCEALSDTSRHFTERGIRPPFALRSTNDERILQMVAAGLGLTVMPISYSHPGVARPRLAGFTITRSIGFLFSRHGAYLRQDNSPLLARVESLIALSPFPS